MADGTDAVLGAAADATDDSVKDALVDAYGSLVDAAGALALTPESSLQGERIPGKDDYTGVYEAARLAVETVVRCVGQVVEATSKMGGITLITADHGNCEQMFQEDGSSPMTAHTTNPVPFCIVGVNVKLRDGILADIAPTMLDLMGLEKPAEMNGRTLIEQV